MLPPAIAHHIDHLVAHLSQELKPFVKEYPLQLLQAMLSVFLKKSVRQLFSNLLTIDGGLVVVG